MTIALVTAALREMLRNQIARSVPDLSDILITTTSPDRARSDPAVPQLNLFLLNAAVDGAWRNDDGLGARAPGSPALGVTLHYLLTAYGRDEEAEGDLVCHRVLGAAMSVIHGSPLLDDIEAGQLSIAHRNMTALEMAALWASFQMPYQLSSAYEVGIVPLQAR